MLAMLLGKEMPTDLSFLICKKKKKKKGNYKYETK